MRPTRKNVPDSLWERSETSGESTGSPHPGRIGLEIADRRTQELQIFLNEPEIHREWESEYLNGDLNNFYDRVFQRLIKILSPKPGEKLLDAGCGYCFHAIRLARSGLQVTGVDFSDVALRRGAENIQHAGTRDQILLQTGDLLNLPFSPRTFDYVHCWGVLMHVPQLETALDELIRVLKPGGKLIIMENNSNSLHVQSKRLMRLARRVLQRPVKESSSTRRGREEWEGKDSGRLLVRASNINFLVRFCEHRGLRLTNRLAGQFTELYTKVSFRILKLAIYKLNELWFAWVRLPGPAMGNILVFERPAPSRSSRGASTDSASPRAASFAT